MRRPFFPALAAAVLTVVLTATGGAAADEFVFKEQDAFGIEFLITIGEHEEALEKASEAIDKLRRSDEPADRVMVGRLLATVCAAHRELGQYPEAEAACQEADAIFENAEQEPRTSVWYELFVMPEITATYEQMGKLDAALDLWRRQLNGITPSGYNAPQRLSILSRIGEIEMSLGRFAAAEKSYLDAVAVFDDLFQEERWKSVAPHAGLGLLYRVEERFDDSEAILRQGLEEAQRTFDKTPEKNRRFFYQNVFLKLSLGWTYLSQGRLDEARKTAQEVAAHFESEGDQDTWFTCNVKTLLGRIEDAERPGSPEAESYLTAAAATPGEEDFPLSYLFIAMAQSELARHYLLTDDFESAEAPAQQASDLFRALFPNTTPVDAVRAEIVLARVLQGQGRAGEALPVLLVAYAAQRQVLPPYHSEIGETLVLMRALYDALGLSENRDATDVLIADYKVERATFEAAR